MKQTLRYLFIIFLAALFTFGLKSCKQATHRPGVIKTDTIIGEYITDLSGDLYGGKVYRTVLYREKIDTKDSVTFTKSVSLDTICTVFITRQIIDSITHKPKLDSLGNIIYKKTPYQLPGRYVKDTGIPTH